MFEAFAIYRDYKKVMDYQQQQQINQFTREYDAEDMEGFKVMFPQEEKVTIETESNEPF